MSTLPEGFKHVPGIARFATSEDGRVFDVLRGTYPSGTLTPDGLIVSFKDNGKSRNYKIQRLVALTWVPIPSEFEGPENLIVKHKDNNKSNNASDNLEWTTTKGKHVKAKEKALSLITLPEGYCMVPGVQRYATNREGSVYDAITQKVVTGSMTATGLTLTYRDDDGVGRSVKVHRMVALTWLEIPQNLKDRGQALRVKHLDENKENNHVDNLQWSVAGEESVDWRNNPIPQGFRRVPGIPFFAANEDGVLYNVKLQRVAATNKVESGYVLTSFVDAGVCKTYRVHRLVAMTWIPIPEHLQDEESLPDINHKDGNKANNAVYNLEWCTDKENQQHAIETGLTGHRRVKAKQLLTNEEFSFSSAHEASRHFGVQVKKLLRVLSSPYAGMITKDYWVFLYEDEQWPEISPNLLIPDRWDKLKGLWVATKDGVQIVGSTLEIVCAIAQVKYYSIQPCVKSDGTTYIVQGIEFFYSNFPTKDLIERAVYSEESPKFRPTRKLLVSITHPIVQSKLFDSITKASKETGVPLNTIAYAIAHKNGYHNGMHFKYVD